MTENVPATPPVVQNHAAGNRTQLVSEHRCQGNNVFCLPNGKQGALGTLQMRLRCGPLVTRCLWLEGTTVSKVWSEKLGVPVVLGVSPSPGRPIL